MQFGNKRFTVAAQFLVFWHFRLDTGFFGGLGNNGVQLALRTQAKRDRIFGNDIGDIPMLAVTDRVNRGAGRADQLANLGIGNFRMVTQQPCNPVWLVLTLGNRRITRTFGAADLIRAFLQLHAIFGIGFGLGDFIAGQFMRLHGITASIFGTSQIVRHRVHFQNVDAAKVGNLLKAQAGIVNQPACSCVRHQWGRFILGHGGVLFTTAFQKDSFSKNKK